MTATFDVSGAKLYTGNHTTLKYPMLLIRFAPNQELNRHPHHTEWQVDVEGNIVTFLDVPKGAKGEHSIEWGKPINTTLNPGTVALAEFLTPNVPVGIMTENLMAYSTPTMKEIMDTFFKEQGCEVVAVGMYNGSFGPSHFLRDGVFYKRPNKKK